MESTELLHLERLTQHHIDGCMALSAEAGWNQTPDDWTLFLRRGTVYGLPGDRGEPVATGAVLPYAGGFAWISMVLVTAPRRRDRIGTRILQKCCADVEERGLVAVLDATPAGERVYRPLGFEPVFGLSRWQGEGGTGEGPPAGIRAMTDGDLTVVAAVDAAAFGASRMFLIESLFRRAPQLAFVMADGSGFALARPGRLATQIGPIVAANEQSAMALLEAALGAATGPVFLDLADRWDGLKRRLEQRGFKVQRPFLRMGLRRATPFGDPARLFVVAGPEFG
jgi:GNAT acetyltransferase-like protein/acetyltransferase (GNAT) family protein